MRSLWDRIAVAWCRMFHPEPSWPIHGRYCCPACLRSYPVPWQERYDFNGGKSRTMAIRVEDSLNLPFRRTGTKCNGRPQEMIDYVSTR